MKKYRYEMKYLVDLQKARIIENKLISLMRFDDNVVGKEYHISSLYFDDYDNNCFYDVDDGNYYKNKYRIRLYNNSYNLIRLEKKSKEGLFTSKEIVKISKKNAELFSICKYPLIEDCDSELIKDFIFNMMSNALEPKIIIQYDRIPLIYSQGNVRITFDKNIMLSNDVNSFLKGKQNNKYILAPHLLILEVKYDDFIPSVIRNILNETNIQQISFSKYHLGRYYSKGGCMYE